MTAAILTLGTVVAVGLRAAAWRLDRVARRRAHPEFAAISAAAWTLIGGWLVLLATATVVLVVELWR